MADNAMDQIKHLVVVMMENRSFDNLAGFLYTKEKNVPPANIPAPPLGQQPSYDGLSDPSPNSDFWNPSNPEYFTANAPPVKVFATQGTTGPEPFLVPDHDPREEFSHISFQILGPQNWSGPRMTGFLVDYLTTDPGHPETAKQLMDCYGPSQLSVISGLAKNYAISDSGHSWKVYNDTILMSLVRLQFPQLWDPLLQPHFRGIGEFEEDAAAGALPEYSFLEPSFQFQANDGHPPHDVCLVEQFLQRIWKAVSTGKNWTSTLLVITFDEHGGCYDHVEPPPAIPPDDAKDPETGFGFDRYGVRVPTLLISPYIEAGTVFRSPTAVPYDHTSILATLRDWLQIPTEKMLTSKRVAKAPTFANVLTRTTARTDLPEIAPACVPKKAALPISVRLNDLQAVMITAHRKRYAHNFGNLVRFKKWRTPPPRPRAR